MSLHTSTLLLRSSCYASITGTSVLRVRGVPPRPPSYDGSLVVFDSPEGASIKERLKGEKDTLGIYLSGRWILMFSASRKELE